MKYLNDTMAGRGRPKGSTNKKKTDEDIELNTKSQKKQPAKNTAENVEPKMENIAESTAVGNVITETKNLAKDIQTTKEVLGDIVYNAFFELGLEPKEMVLLLEGAIEGMIDNYTKYNKLAEEHEIAMDLLQNLLSEFSKKKLAVDLVKQYQQDCVANQITPDIDYVNSLLMEGIIDG